MRGGEQGAPPRPGHSAEPLVRVSDAPQRRPAAPSQTSIRARVESLRRATIAACLAAMKDDSEAVERCARLSRKLSFAERLLRH